MELRSAENELEELRTLYQKVADYQICNDNNGGDAHRHQEELSAMEALQTLETTKHRLEQLQPKIDKFRKRLKQTDPVTGNNRYGEKTALRVNALLKSHDELQLLLAIAFGEDDTTNGNNTIIVNPISSSRNSDKAPVPPETADTTTPCANTSTASSVYHTNAFPRRAFH